LLLPPPPVTKESKLPLRYTERTVEALFLHFAQQKLSVKFFFASICVVMQAAKTIVNAVCGGK
jgi:hypothetical protein